MLRRKKDILITKSFAKLNLFLKVLGKGEDGYHDIFSLVVKVSVADILYFERLSSPRVELSTNHSELPTDERNTVRLAALLFKELFSIRDGIRVFIHKRIPISSGMGGESSNAAYTILALREMFGVKIPQTELYQIGERIGSDVNFFLNGKCAIIYGRGEHILPLTLTKRIWFVLIFQDYGVSTKEAYLKADSLIKTPKKQLYLLYNDLDIYQEKTQSIRENLLKLGCVATGITGSGPTIVGMCPNLESAKRISLTLKANGIKNTITSTL